MTLISMSFEAPCEGSDVCDEDPCDSALDGCFEVLGQPSAAIEPSKGTLDHPAARQNLEAFGGIATSDDLDGPAAELGERVLEFFSGVTAIGEDMAQPRIELADRRQNSHGTIAVLNVGGMNQQSDKIALRVGDDMALAPLDLLARIEAARTATFCGFHGLAVDHARRGAGFAPTPFARRHDKRVVDLEPGAILCPAIEITLHRRI